VENCNANQTVVWFALQRPVAASGTDLAYTLYYGNSLAANPPANGMNVFLFFENWEQGSAHWISAGGLDPGNAGAGTGTMGTSTIVNTAALSPSNSQYFVTRRAGGDAWSGFIPVSPSTSYAFSTWAYTTSPNVCAAVGIYNYTSGYVQGAASLWYDNWPLPSNWSWRTLTFTTASTTAFVKIWDEIWTDCAGSPAYVDNIALRYSIGSEPGVVLGVENSNLAAPVISIISEPGTVSLGSSITASADISIATGTIASATLQILSPQTVDVDMTLTAGDYTNGTWTANFTPGQGGVYTYRVRAVSLTGLISFSTEHNFTVNDTTPPVITPVSIIDPILVKNTQTLSVSVTENGAISSVTVTVDGTTHPMSGVGSLYSYSWQVNNTGIIPYSITATNTSNVTATLNGSFVSQPRAVDVCTWKDCRQGAASWSKDDGNYNCLSELTTAGIRGTFYYNGTSTPTWFAQYSALGHEIASHTVTHPCNVPACSPNCTEQALAALPVEPAIVTAYRLNELEPNIAAIQAGTGKAVLSLAWPCGCTDPSRWTAAQSYYLGARGYYWDLKGDTWQTDVNLTTPANIWNLNTDPRYTTSSLIDQAYAEGKWSITTAHSECDGISYIGAQNTNGHMWVAPVGEVLKYIYVRNASQFSNYSRVARTISFDVVHNLTTFQPTSITTPTPYTFLPIEFNNPVTLKVHIQDTDTVIGVTVSSNPVSYAIKSLEGARYVTFDATLNTSRHVVVSLAAPAPALSQISASDPVELGSLATVNATVIPVEDTTLGPVTLRVLSPETHDYPMSLVAGDQYAAAFTPVQTGTYSYQVIATNTEGGSTQSTPADFEVRDTTPPISRNQSQSLSQILNGGSNTLSVEGYDLGSLSKVVLSTDESGTWQAFDWPVTDWWNQSWSHRRPLTLNEPAGFDRSAETVDLLIEATSYPGLTSCNELRMADANRNEVPVQVYGSLPTCHLLFQASIPANSSRTYYVYYGNPSAPAPNYSSDLTVLTNGSLRTIQNTYFNLDLDTGSTAGIISRLRLLQGTNTDLPLSTSSNAYWGWHHACSSLHGNITGKGQCQGGNAQASGLTMAETLSGPLVREYTLTSVKAEATYTVTYRFIANAPYYEYRLSRTGTTAVVMNNFWYLNAPINFGRIGAGIDGGPSYPSYNTYENANDYLRIVSSAAIAAGKIDGTDNDGSFLGGTAYNIPSATGLNLYVAAGTSPAAASAVLDRVAAQLVISGYGPVENAPAPVYGSPFEPSPGTGWVPVSFTWQNPAIQNRLIHWRVTFYDMSGNAYTTTPVISFSVGSPTAVTVASFTGTARLGSVQLEWETANEVGLVGFNLYRAETLDGAKHKLNADLIPALNPDTLLGASYQFSDVVDQGKRYYYWLELVKHQGTELLEPVTVDTDYLIRLPVLIR
jgi:hypothetical protein